MPNCDVIIIGAGFTGLSAAAELRGKGMRIRVLEARERVGGRVESRLLEDGSRIDSGGQFLCEDMSEVMALARAHGKTLVHAHVEGEITFQPPSPGNSGYENLHAVDALRAAIRAMDPESREVAGLTVGDWLARQAVPDAVRRGFRGLIEGLWCRSIDEISLSYLISTDRRITNTQSELQLFIAETMHSLAEDLARDISDDIVLASPVTRVEHSPDGVTVFCGDVAHTARRAIVALPPVMARRLDYAPALDAGLVRSLAAWNSGTVIKVLLAYDRPFWRDLGLSGTIMWQDPAGLYACDASPSEKQAAIVVFLGGPLARQWHGRSVDDFREFILGKLGVALGDAAARPAELCVRDWTDDAWSGGAYSDTVTDLAAVDVEATLLKGQDCIQFASSELSPSFPGYIEGAIIAGRQAANTAIALLRDR